MRSVKAIATLEDCKGVWGVLTPQCASAARYRWVLAELEAVAPLMLGTLPWHLQGLRP